MNAAEFSLASSRREGLHTVVQVLKRNGVVID
jgi:hypothetical protein